MSLKQLHCQFETIVQCSLSKSFESIISFLSFENSHLREEPKLIRIPHLQIKRALLFHDFPSNALKLIGNFYQSYEVCIQPLYPKIQAIF